MVHLSWGEGEEPYLVMTCHPGDEPGGEPAKLDQIGVSHFLFTVDDVMGLANELVVKGVEIPGASRHLPTMKDSSAPSTSSTRMASWSNSTADPPPSVRFGDYSAW